MQGVTRESLVMIRYDECLAGNIVVMVYKWYCGKDVNASALNQHSSGKIVLQQIKANINKPLMPIF